MSIVLGYGDSVAQVRKLRELREKTEKTSLHSAAGDRAAASSRESAKAETREALILAALTEFAAHGIDAPSLDAICARAGYTRGAFYVHFHDRDELIAAVMERVIGAIMDALIARGDAALDFQRTLSMFTDAVRYGAYPPASSVRSHQVLHACERSSVVRQQYVALLQQAKSRVGAVVREGQQARTLRSDVDSEQAGLLLIALVMAVQTLIEVGFPFDVDQAAATVAKLLAAR